MYKTINKLKKYTYIYKLNNIKLFLTYLLSNISIFLFFNKIIIFYFFYFFHVD